MPIMDGFEATEKILDYQIKSVTSNDNLRTGTQDLCKVVALTAYVNTDNTNRCKDIGM